MITMGRKKIRDDSGFTYFEAIATLVMVAVAVVATTYSLYYAERSLAVDMHKQQINRIVQQELEYWIGRIYTGTPDDPNNVEKMGSVQSPYKTVILDPDSKKPIQVKLFYDPIIPIPSVEFPGTIAYYKITVWAEWEEPDKQQFKRSQGREISLTTYVAQSGVAG